MLDYIIDDIIEEELVLPEVEDVSDEVAVEVLDYYNDKARRRELKEVASLSSEILHGLRYG